ncbi:hypothetical protein U9M48_001909 [Paspalum notatum var. saurae]|uniref:DDE Tnp4 domain-containing protein n=1 Tax=Paspalum notatum var. saurae TaxID=547442 RepID=A0AAQ3PPR0_PASNO
MVYWTLLIYRWNANNPIRYSLLERNKERMKYLQKLYCGEERHCISELRMGKSVFFKLCQKLRNMGSLRDTWHCTVEEQIAMFLTTVGHHKKNCDISFHFTRSGETVSRYFNHVLYAIGQLGPEMLRHRSLDIPSKILGNPRFDPYFKDCIGAIDGTHIPCNIPSRIVDRFRGRKPFPTQNILAVVDFDLMFTYVSAGWEESAHDSTVLRHSLEHPNGLRVPEGWFLSTNMAGNNIVWQPQVVDDMLHYYKEKIQAEGRQIIFREVHHEECAKQLNAKYHSQYTHRQVYHKFHKLKGQWRVILQAKNLSGANFDDVGKQILYDETEVVRMQNVSFFWSFTIYNMLYFRNILDYEIHLGHMQDKDPRAKFINVPIRNYDVMEFVFQDKHATGEFTVLQTPYDIPSSQDTDLVGDKDVNNSDIDPSLQYDSDCIADEDGTKGSSSVKRPTSRKSEKGKRTKRDDGVITEVTNVLRDMSDTMRFTHVSHPNEDLFKTIDAMEEYPVFVRLELQEYLATNEKIASMLKGRPLDIIKEYVQRWFVKHFPSLI